MGLCYEQCWQAVSQRKNGKPGHGEPKAIDLIKHIKNHTAVRRTK